MKKIESVNNSQDKDIFYLGTRLSLIFIFIAVIGFLILLLPMLIEGYDYKTLGFLGGITGGFLNPIIAIAATLLTFLAFYVQYQANQQVQHQFFTQQFDNQFYKMLDLHKDNINEMQVSFKDHQNKEEYERVDNKTISINKFESTVVSVTLEGRKLFPGMIKELDTIISIVIEKFKLLTSKDLSDYPNIYEYALDYSYRLFFFGLYSEQASLPNCYAVFQSEVVDKLLEIQESFYNRNKLSITNRQSITQFDFYPFEGHESRLSHYYRNLYAIVKMVVNKFNGEYGSENYKLARNYLKTLRAQLSNSEQHLLYLNYRIGFGKDWNRTKIPVTNYLTTYRMVHNIPVDRITIPENPRKHFENYIKSNEVSSSDPLFEWGD